ncbi:MAG: DUF460 domain-containing protein [Nanoarchaeota archaeon]
MKQLAIIGLDPGTTSAYAAVDLRGKLIKTNSAKEMPLSEVIEQLTEFCLPVIVSTDKAKVPSFVGEFSRKVGARLVIPDEDLKKEEKRILTGGMQTLKSEHEQDALSAALFAYKKYLPKLEKINRFIEYSSLQEKRDEFARLALLEDLNFHVIREILTRENNDENKIIKEAVAENRITKKNFLALYEKFSTLKKEKEHLERKIKELNLEMKLVRRTNLLLDKKSSNFNQRIDTLLKFKENRMHLQNSEIEKQDKKIESLNGKINSLFCFIGETQKCLLLKKLKTLSYEEFSGRSEILNIGENDFLFVENTNVFSEKVIGELHGKGIKVISASKISKKIKEHFQATVISAEDIYLENEYFALIDRDKLKIDDNSLIEKIVGEYRERRRRD